jgi:hypothetical protein
MRILMQCEFPVKVGNKLASKGELGSKIEQILAEQKPEAVYFGLKNGRRTAFIILNLESASEIPKVVEPWFLAFNASVESQVVMVPADLAAAGPDIGAAVEKYGS